MHRRRWEDNIKMDLLKKWDGNTCSGLMWLITRASGRSYAHARCRAMPCVPWIDEELAARRFRSSLFPLSVWKVQMWSRVHLMAETDRAVETSVLTKTETDSGTVLNLTVQCRCRPVGWQCHVSVAYVIVWPIYIANISVRAVVQNTYQHKLHTAT